MLQCEIEMDLKCLKKNIISVPFYFSTHMHTISYILLGGSIEIGLFILEKATIN